MNDRSLLAGVFVTGVALCVTVSATQTMGAASDPPALKTYHFAAKDLPEPSEGKPNGSKLVPKPADAALAMPPGFKVDLFADGVAKPRWAVQAPGGDVFVSEQAGTIHVLHDANGNHTIEAAERSEFATGLNKPFGMAFAKGYFYVATTDAVVRFPYKKGQLKAAGAPEKIADLPSGPTGHWTRSIRFTPDGSSFYVTVGSSSNVDVETDPLRATILRFKADGSGREVIATGVRNAVGLDLHPKTKEPWIAVQERDGLGDHLAPDFVASVRPGVFYGWPYAYAGAHEDPRHKGEKPDLVAKSATPEVLLQPHSAVMGLTFYTGKQFPAKYRTGAFAAFRGSSHGAKRTGYKVVFLPFADGKATGGYEDFVAGWMLGEDRAEVWGRPVGLAVLQDGSLLVTDDAGGKIYRVSYSN